MKNKMPTKEELEDYHIAGKMILFGLMLILFISLVGATENIQFRYIPNTNFNMSDGCNGEIVFKPDSSHNFMVCLKNDIGSIITDSCKNYLSGEYNFNTSFTTAFFDRLLLTNGNNYSFYLDWKRIKYIDMNTSALNGYNDSGGYKPSIYKDGCPGSDGTVGGTMTQYQLGSGCLNITGTANTFLAQGHEVYNEQTDCSGTNYMIIGPNNYTTYTQGRVYENYVRTGGSIAVLNNYACRELIRWSYYGINCWSGGTTPYDYYSYDSCTPGDASTLPINLCTYAGDYDSTSEEFNYNDSLDSNNVTFNAKFLSSGSVSWVLELDNCSSYSNLILNYTLYDEDNLSLISSTQNPNIKVTATISSSTETLSNYSMLFLDNNAKICVSSSLPEDTGLFLSTITEYSADDYAHEFMYIRNMPLTETTIPQHIKLYDLLTTQATSFLITFRNDVFLPVEDAVIEIYRYYTGLGNTLNVEDGLTDVSGQTIGHFLKEDAIYSFVIKRDNEILATFDNLQAICLDNPCQINLNQFQILDELPNWGEHENLVYSFEDFNKSERTVRVTFATKDSSVADMVLNVTVMDSYMNLTGCMDTISSASGTLNCTVPQGYGNTSIYVRLTYGGDYVTTRQYSLMASAFEVFGYIGIFMATIIILMLIFMAISDPIGVVVFAIIGVIVSGSLSLLTIGPIFTIGSIVIWLIISGAILIWKIQEQS